MIGREIDFTVVRDPRDQDGTVRVSVLNDVRITWEGALRMAATLVQAATDAARVAGVPQDRCEDAVRAAFAGVERT